jgi:RNA polymerase sigma-70 factor (ECF subfamily)
MKLPVRQHAFFGVDDNIENGCLVRKWLFMNDTSLSLLMRLKDSDNGPENWERLVQIYSPLLKAWIWKYKIQPSDADDLVQEVLLAVASNLKTFEHNGRRGAFRAWLRITLVHRIRNFWRSRQRQPAIKEDSDAFRQLSMLEDPNSPASELWGRQHDRYVLQKLLVLCKPHFTAETWTAFSRVALQSENPDVVAAELGVSLNSVFIAKSRVLSRLRREAEGLVDSFSRF